MQTGLNICIVTCANSRKLDGMWHVGDCIAKSRLEVVRVKEPQFADDTAATYATSQAAIQQSAKDFISTTDN
jgi:hypothetical protein